MDSIKRIQDLLDKQVMSRGLIIIVILVFFSWFAEGFDVAVIGGIMVGLNHAWHLTSSQQGILGISSTVGVLLGLLISSFVTDSIGRKSTLIIGLLIFTIMTPLGAFTNSVGTIAAFRLLGGIGLGFVFPLPYTYLSEIVPQKWRGLLISLATLGIGLGTALTFLLSGPIYQAYGYDMGWRYILGLTVLPLILVPFIIRYLPESPRWLLKKGKYEKAQRAIYNITGKTIDLETTDGERVSVREVPATAIFRKPYIGRSVMLWLAYFAQLYVWYVGITYLPLILEKRHLLTGSALQLTAFVILINELGLIMNGWLGDRFSRKNALIIFQAIGVVSLVLAAYSSSTVMIYITALCIGIFVYGPFGTMKAYIAEQYPTSVRGRGTYIAELVARFLAGVVGLYLVPFMISGLGPNSIFWTGAAALLIFLVIPFTIWGKETSNVQIEITSGENDLAV